MSSHSIKTSSKNCSVNKKRAITQLTTNTMSEPKLKRRKTDSKPNSCLKRKTFLDGYKKALSEYQRILNDYDALLSEYDEFLTKYEQFLNEELKC